MCDANIYTVTSAHVLLLTLQSNLTDWYSACCWGPCPLLLPGHRAEGNVQAGP